jgi:hypothetical protein
MMADGVAAVWDGGGLAKKKLREFWRFRGCFAELSRGSDAARSLAEAW